MNECGMHILTSKPAFSRISALKFRFYGNMKSTETIAVSTTFRFACEQKFLVILLSDGKIFKWIGQMDFGKTWTSSPVRVKIRDGCDEHGWMVRDQKESRGRTVTQQALWLDCFSYSVTQLVINFRHGSEDLLMKVFIAQINFYKTWNSPNSTIRYKRICSNITLATLFIFLDQTKRIPLMFP